MNDNANALRSKNAKRAMQKRDAEAQPSATKGEQKKRERGAKEPSKETQKRQDKRLKEETQEAKRGKRLRRAGKPKGAPQRTKKGAQARRGEATAL